MKNAEFLKAFSGKCTGIYNLCIKKMYDAIRTTGIYALPVHYHTHFYRKTEPLAAYSLN